MTTELRKWLAVGTGVGIEIGSKDLDVTIARVRPHGIAVLGSATVTDFRTRPANEWGTELLAFLRKIGAVHIAATVLLPRRDVIVRQLNLPGVSNKDLVSAIAYQIDGLHPFGDDEAVYAYARVNNTGAVLVGITHRDVIQEYSNLFTEIGLKIASFTFSAAVLHGACRMMTEGPGAGFLAVRHVEGEVEVYGESEARPVFSATLPSDSPGALGRVASELRLSADTIPRRVEELLPKPVVYPASHDPNQPEFAQHALPYATAVVGACPWLADPANLLPAEQRQSSSRLRLVPTLVLATALVACIVALTGYNGYENAQYLKTLQAEISRLEPQARKVQVLDKNIAITRQRTVLLDDFRKHSKADLDVLNELTKLLPPPTWVSSLQITRSIVQVNGEADQAAGLLKVMDDSPLFEKSEFTTAPTRVSTGEAFGIRASRRGAPKESQPR